METAEQEAVLTARAAHDALARNDFDALRALLAEDVVWHADGDAGQSGTYRGRDAVIEALRAQQANGVIEAYDVTETSEPEVEAFAFGPRLGSAFVTTRITGQEECGDLTTVMQINGPIISSFGSMPTTRSF